MWPTWSVGGTVGLLVIPALDLLVHACTSYSKKWSICQKQRLWVGVLKGCYINFLWLIDWNKVLTWIQARPHLHHPFDVFAEHLWSKLASHLRCGSYLDVMFMKTNSWAAFIARLASLLSISCDSVIYVWTLTIVLCECVRVCVRVRVFVSHSWWHLWWTALKERWKDWPSLNCAVWLDFVVPKVDRISTETHSGPKNFSYFRFLCEEQPLEQVSKEL